MKLYDPKSLPRLMVLTIALILTSVWLAIAPRPTYIPQTADPETLYHVVWQVAGETFFDTGKLEDWKKWEHKFDGKLKSQEDAQKAIDEMLKSLDDPYTFYQGVQATTAENDSRQGTFVGIGVAFGAKIENEKPVLNAAGEVLPEQSSDRLPLVKQVLEGGAAEKAGIRDGDAIVSVNGKSVSDLSLNKLVETIKGESGSDVKIVVRRGAQELTFTLKRGPVEVK
jgi:carboxyl-terminal processing protease